MAFARYFCYNLVLISFWESETEAAGSQVRARDGPST